MAENPAKAPARWSPAVRRQRLADVLADLRTRDGRSAATVAAALGVAESTVTRLENPRHLRLPKAALIGKLLDLYDADPATRDRVATLIAEARQKDWLHPYKAYLPAPFSSYLSLTPETAVQRIYQPLMLPGLLQTEAYATATCPARLPALPPEQVGAFAAELTRQHQHLLTGPDPVRLWLVLGEAALHQCVGGPKVMAEQLDHLYEVIQLPHVTATIVPFAAGAHPGTAPFAVLSFPQPTDPESAYLPDPLGGHWVRGAAVEQYRAVFEELLRLFPDRDENLKMVSQAAAAFRRG